MPGPTSMRPPRSQPGRRGNWLLLAIIIVTSLATLLTLGLFAQTLPVAMHPLPSATNPETGNPARAVVIQLEGRQQIWQTALDNPQKILEEAGIAIQAGDKIWVNGAFALREALPGWTVPAWDILIRRPLILTIIDDGAATELLTEAETVADALASLEIALHERDMVDPPRATRISGDMTVTIERALPITLIVDGVLLEARSSAGTVAELLEELDVSLYSLDFVSPPGDSPVMANMRIEIVRVTEEIVAQSERVPHELRYEADASLPLDQTRVIQAGSDGLLEVRSRVRYENGREVSRALEETVQTQPPEARVIRYGTALTLRSVDTPEGPRQYWRVLCMLATSYHPAALGGDDTTAIGWKLKKGVVAADPALIRYRTQVYVPGYGVGAMADTGGPRSSPYWIDLGYSDEDWTSWRRYVKVYLLTPTPAEIDYLLPAWTPNRSYAGSCGD